MLALRVHMHRDRQIGCGSRRERVELLVELFVVLTGRPAMLLESERGMCGDACRV